MTKFQHFTDMLAKTLRIFYYNKVYLQNVDFTAGRIHNDFRVGIAGVVILKIDVP